MATETNYFPEPIHPNAHDFQVALTHIEKPPAQSTLLHLIQKITLKISFCIFQASAFSKTQTKCHNIIKKQT